MDDLIQSAKALALRRWGSSGWAGAVALRLDDGRTLTSVFVETPNEAANLCHETGAICEAHKLNVRIVASACVSREAGQEDFVVLTPCGICQERLAFWGPDVRVAVPVDHCPTNWEVKTLREIQPHYWARVYQRGWR